MWYGDVSFSGRFSELKLCSNRCHNPSSQLHMTRTNFLVKPGEKDVVLEGVLNASRADVWKAYTNPELVPSWWGSKKMMTVVEKMNFKEGGQWRFVQLDPLGKEHDFNGRYLKIVPRKRIICTLEFEDDPGRVAQEKITFKDSGSNQTKFRIDSHFETVEDRDQMLGDGLMNLAHL